MACDKRKESSGVKALTRRMMAPVDMSNWISTMRFQCRHKASSEASAETRYQKSMAGLDHISRRSSALSSSRTICRDLT